MNLKTRIKNDMWQVNFILPFVKKHQFDESGKVNVIKHILIAYKDIKLIKGKKKRTIGNDTKELLISVDINIHDDSQFVYFIDTKKTIAVPGNILCNFTLDYDKIIHGTFKQLECKAVGNDEYGEEARAVIDGIKSLVLRTKEAILNSKLPEKEKRFKDFECILETATEHFDEALQRILFFNQIMWQTRHRLNGLGRLDKILNDLYQKDVEEGILSYDSASNMIGDFLTQLSRYSNYKSDALKGDIGQIIILGGLNPDKTYFTNDLTEIFLEEQAKLKSPDPKTLLRVSQNMPKELLNTAVSCLLSKTGSPLFSNDDVIIPSLLDFGISGVDAYNYCTSACWEPFIVGKSLDQNNIAVFDYFLALEEVLNRNIQTFEELINAYIAENKKKFKKFLDEIDQVKWARDPLVSIFTDGCSEARQDISIGPCCYKNYGITTVAVSNVIDSLFNIERLVFDQKKYSLVELNEIRRNEFNKKEDLYAELRGAKKYYGHDDVRTINLVNRITDSISDVAINYKNKYGGTIKFGLSSPGYNILCTKTKADIAGRKSGMPYNTHISCLDAPYTEIVGFASKLSYDRQRFNGNVIDFFVAPVFISENIEKFVLFMKGAIVSGFFQMQMNIMDSSTLIDAKAHPGSYIGLIVRVWGFSAYFNELPETYKDLLIERAVAAEKIASV